MIRVALDAMGTDQAPRTEVEGVALALRELPPAFTVQLVGQTAAIEAELAKHADLDRSRVEIIEAPEVIGMAEKPLQAVRKKRKSSLVIGLGLQAQGKSDAFISAGQHRRHARRLHGAARPPRRRGARHGGHAAADGGRAGPHARCRGQRRVLGPRAGGLCPSRHRVHAHHPRAGPNPKVGLLNVGEEEEKGTAIVKEAYRLLKLDPRLNFVGNIEGRDILGGHPKHGRLDVVVCDGFVGNVVLKFYESVMFLVRHLAEEGAPDMWERKEIRAAFRMLDYSQYGGAPLLGVKGVSIICHGSSNANAIHHAIRVAVQSVEVDLAKHIGAEFAEREAAARL